MNDYHDLMNEYQDVKNEISQQSLNVLSAVIRIKSFYTGIENLRSNIKMIPGQKPKAYEKIDKDIIDFSKNLMKFKNDGDNEIIIPLNNLLESANMISKQNLDRFNDIKISLIQERQKLNKTKNDYFNFISGNSNQKCNNEDETLLYNAKKQNYYQLYKYEINQMNTIIDENNIKYENMYNDLRGWKEIQKHKIKMFFTSFAKNIEKIGNLFLEYSKILIDDINGEKEFDKNYLESEKAKIKMPRFEKVKIEEIIETKEELNKNKINNNNNKEQYLLEIPTPMGAKSNYNKDEDFSDFDIIDNFEDINELKNEKKNKKDSKINIFSKHKKTEKSKKDNKINNDISSNNNVKTSTGFDEFEIVENNELLFQNKDKNQNEKLLDDIILKIISKDELLSQEISTLMNLLKEEDPSTKKYYSYTFLTKLNNLNNRYIINLKNKKNFIHLSNILNDISIKQNKIDILKLIIDISQIITYQQWYLFNLLQKKNKYLSTKTFWSKIIVDLFINDLNKQVNIIMKENNNNEISKNKEKESNVFLLEFIRFSNNITNYKKLNTEQKIKLDKFARKNIDNVVTKVIEGMCSFLVQRNIAIEVFTDFGKNFGFNSENLNYYKMLLDLYMNRNYRYNLKQLSLKDEKEHLQKKAKICIISNAAKFLPKKDLLNLLVLEKDMTQKIKKNIFRNYLSQEMTIDERTKIWGLMLRINELKKEYDYKKIKENVLTLIENKQMESKVLQNIGIIELDVARTFFLNKKEVKKYQNSVRHILVVLIYTLKDIGYFQGMNYIASFLLQIFDYDEEKAFYYMLGIEKNTKFKELFENNLYILQLFFKVFDNILKINIPEFFKLQINNQINPNFYLPPWFLTLFTFFSTKFEKDKAPKFMVLVVENFFLNGWSAIFNAGYTIIKYLKNELIKLKGDALMNFMVNTMGQEEILKEENTDIINKEYIKNSYQINEELISKLLKLAEMEKKNNNLFIK